MAANSDTSYRVCECGRFQGDPHIVIQFRGEKIGEFPHAEAAIKQMLASIDRTDLTDDEAQLFTKAGHAALTCLPLRPEEAGDTEAFEWSREVFIDEHPRLRDMVRQMFTVTLNKSRDAEEFSYIKAPPTLISDLTIRD